MKSRAEASLQLILTAGDWLEAPPLGLQVKDLLPPHPPLQVLLIIYAKMPPGLNRLQKILLIPTISLHF